MAMVASNAGDGRYCCHSYRPLKTGPALITQHRAHACMDGFYHVSSRGSPLTQPLPMDGCPGTIFQPLPGTPQPLDLEATFTCGQIFRWRRDGSWWHGTRGPAALAVRHTGE